MSCLVVVPAYNEAATIVEVATRASRHADVCVVDDASTDGTAALVEALPRVHVVRHARNTHIAGALLDGFRYARERGYDHCVTMDAGLSHDPDAIPGFQAHADADLVIGYRTRREGVPFSRVALSQGANWLMNLSLERRFVPWGGAGLRDCTSGLSDVLAARLRAAARRPAALPRLRLPHRVALLRLPGRLVHRRGPHHLPLHELLAATRDRDRGAAHLRPALVGIDLWLQQPIRRLDGSRGAA